MGKYSKLFGTVLGGVVGIVGSVFGAQYVEWVTPEVQMAAVTLFGAVGTFLFPANA